MVAAPAVAGWRDLTGHWAESGIAALQAKGIVTGVDQETFLPDAPLTRAQVQRQKHRYADVLSAGEPDPR